MGSKSSHSLFSIPRGPVNRSISFARRLRHSQARHSNSTVLVFCPTNCQANKRDASSVLIAVVTVYSYRAAIFSQFQPLESRTIIGYSSLFVCLFWGQNHNSLFGFFRLVSGNGLISYGHFLLSRTHSIIYRVG